MRDELATVTITSEHLKLLRWMQVRWCHDEYGAPEVNPKRPYGNSDVERDIAEILGLSVQEDRVPEHVAEHARNLHGETAAVLQIVLQHGTFDVIGTWRREKYTSRWTRA